MVQKEKLDDFQKFRNIENMYTNLRQEIFQGIMEIDKAGVQRDQLIKR